ncbi:hypothetical protein FB451DRAFT_1369881 [Mycena latifolia]|nr:hypothetical protein FB451DRAFT_1369881 [Mycena latifolia]
MPQAVSRGYQKSNLDGKARSEGPLSSDYAAQAGGHAKAVETAGRKRSDSHLLRPFSGAQGWRKRREGGSDHMIGYSWRQASIGGKGGRVNWDHPPPLEGPGMVETAGAAGPLKSAAQARVTNNILPAREHPGAPELTGTANTLKAAARSKAWGYGDKWGIHRARRGVQIVAASEDAEPETRSKWLLRERKTGAVYEG